MKVIKKTISKNSNEIILIDSGKTTNKTILIIGVFHGEEPQGKFLIENYLQNLNENFKFKNRMLFIPCLNPDGMCINCRQNSNGIDLNRNFPTKNWTKINKDSDYYGGEKPASEIETKFVMKIMEEFSPDVILTLHAPYKVVNYDGPASEYAEEISKIIDHPTSSDIGYPTPGSFGNYAGVERNIPTITLELNEEADIRTLINPINRIFDYLSNI